MELILPQLPFGGSGTWAARPAPIPANGTLYFATDLGENGTLLQSNGTRWRPVNGAAALKTLGNTTGAIAAVETIVLQALLPVAAWQTNDCLLLSINANKSGTTDTANMTVRIGTAGTTADTSLAGLGPVTIMSAAQQTGGLQFVVKLLSATSVGRLGSNSTGISGYGGGSAGGIPSNTAITDASANALYVSIGIASSGATNTVAVQSCQIQMITP